MGHSFNQSGIPGERVMAKIELAVLRKFGHCCI